MPSTKVEKRPRPERKRAPKPDPIEREYRRLALSVGDDTGFRLHLATYDFPRKRDRLIERLQAEALDRRLCITRLHLGGCDREDSLARLLRKHIERTRPKEPGWRQAVMVSGLEELLDYGLEADMRFLETANLQRDVLPEAAPVPVVLWLSRLASTALPAAAPDLWHWRAANFDFTGDEAPRLELLREMATLNPEDEGGVSAEQRRARIRMLEDLLAELEREGPPKSKRQAAERAHLLQELGIEGWRLGHAAEAIPRFERALDLYREIGDRRGEAGALNNLGLVYSDLGESRRAIEFYQRTLAVACELGHPRVEGAALGNLGIAYRRLGEVPRAIEHHEQALVIWREIGDRRGEGKELGHLATAYADLGEVRRAIEHYGHQLAIAREIGDRRGEGAALGGLGVAYASLGQLREAIERLEQSLGIIREIGDRWGEGNARGNLGNAYANLGEVRRAIEHYERQLPIAREIGDRRGEARALFNGALGLYDLGEQAKAIEWLKGALAIEEAIEDPTVDQTRAKLAEWTGD